jgi:hypothetical protein
MKFHIRKKPIELGTQDAIVAAIAVALAVIWLFAG